MSVYSLHADSLAALSVELGADSPTFVYDGGTYTILPGGAKFKRQNGIGGFELSNDLQLTCLTAQFGGNLPDSGEGMIYNGTSYTIVSVTPAPAGYQMRINADRASQGM